MASDRHKLRLLDRSVDAEPQGVSGPARGEVRGVVEAVLIRYPDPYLAEEKSGTPPDKSYLPPLVGHGDGRIFGVDLDDGHLSHLISLSYGDRLLGDLPDAVDSRKPIPSAGEAVLEVNRYYDEIFACQRPLVEIAPVCSRGIWLRRLHHGRVRKTPSLRRAMETFSPLESTSTTSSL